MELEKLYSFVLLIVTVGMLIGIGVLTTEKFGSSTYDYVYNYNDSTTTANGTRIALDKGNHTSLDAVWNGTANLLPDTCYTVFPVNGSVEFNNQTVECQVWSATMYVVYDYKDYKTTTRDTMTSIGNEISGIATNWLGLIVTVAILAIVLFLVINSFGSMQRR